MEDVIQTPTINSLELLGALQRTFNDQINNVTSHGLILVDASLVKKTIDALRCTSLKTFSTLHGYLNDGESLTPIEYTLLEMLIAAGGEAVPYEELNERAGIVSGPGQDEMNSLWVHKRRLVTKLRPEFELITLRKRGYALLKAA